MMAKGRLWAVIHTDSVASCEPTAQSILGCAVFALLLRLFFLDLDFAPLLSAPLNRRPLKRTAPTGVSCPTRLMLLVQSPRSTSAATCLGFLKAWLAHKLLPSGDQLTRRTVHIEVLPAKGSTMRRSCFQSEVRQRTSALSSHCRRSTRPG